MLLELADAFSRRARRSTQRRGRGAAGQRPLFGVLLPDGRQDLGLVLTREDGSFDLPGRLDGQL